MTQIIIALVLTVVLYAALRHLLGMALTAVIDGMDPPSHSVHTRASGRPAVRNPGDHCLEAGMA